MTDREKLVEMLGKDANLYLGRHPNDAPGPTIVEHILKRAEAAGWTIVPPDDGR